MLDTVNLGRGIVIGSVAVVGMRDEIGRKQEAVVIGVIRLHLDLPICSDAIHNLEVELHALDIILLEMLEVGMDTDDALRQIACGFMKGV